jgi:stage II sporulation protein AA (anti-sigma F factor antagonist)
MIGMGHFYISMKVIHMKTEFQNGVLTAYLDGEIDHDSAAKIRSEVDAAAHTLKPRVLCLDFGGVSFMDSSGVGLVMGRYRQMKLLGGALRVKNYSDSVYRIFAMSGLEALGVLQ